MTRPQRVAHVVINVTDLEKSKRFYCDGLGMSATGSGIVADPGLSYSNLFLYYSRDRSVGADGEVVATGHNSVLMDMNTIAWVSEKRVFGNAKFSMIATIPIANNSLSSDVNGAISGGGGRSPGRRGQGGPQCREPGGCAG